MGKDKLEHSIKSKLSSYESAVNTDSLWAGIQTGLAESTTATAATTATASSIWSSKLLIGLSVLTIGLLGIGGLWYVNSNNQSLNNLNEDKFTLENTSRTSENTEKTSENTQATNISTTLISDEKNEIIAESTEIIEKRETVINNNTNTEKSVNQPNPYNAEAKTPLDVNPANNAQANNTQTNNTQTKDFATNDQAENKQNNQDSSIPQAAEVAKDADTNSSAIPTSEDESLFAKEESLETKNSISTSLLDRFLLDELDDQKSLADLKINGCFVDSNIECPDFGGGGSKGYFVGELQVIPYYSIPRITATNELGEIWKANKESTESYLETFQINLLGRYQLKNGLYLNAGVGYGQLDEKFEFDFSETIVSEQEDIPIIIIIRPDDTRDTIIGSGTVIQDTSAIWETFNYHRMFEFTAAVGYELPVSNSVGFYGDLGLSINISTVRNGWHLLDDIDAVEFPSQNRAVFNTTTGYKLTGGLGIRYYLPGGIVLSGGPEFRSHLTNWIRDEHPIELRYFDIGLRLAVGYVF